MSKLYSIGDVHGCAHSLSNLLSDIPLQTGDRLVFLGDYVDRGPDSRGVVDQILDLRKRSFDVTTLLGNHELMFMEAEKDPDDAEFWANRILKIDTGCVFSHIEGLGHLTAYEVTEGRLFHVPNCELQ